MKADWYNFTNKAKDSAELMILDEIHPWYGTGAQDFHEQLKAVKGKDLDVYLNTPGGSVYEGHTITNMLINHDGVVRVHILGIAASIGSVIAMAADPGELHMPANSALFIHLPLVSGIGNEDEWSKAVEDLQKVKEGIISAYQRHSNLSREELEKAMREERLFTAEEAAESFGAIVQPVVKIAAKFDDSCLSDKALTFYNNSKSEEFSSGDRHKTEPKERQNTMSKELEAKVSSLEAENQKLVVAQKTELQLTTASAIEKTQNDEKARREDVKAISDKYDKEGDLSNLLVTALLNGTSVEDFKDQVLAYIAENRGTKSPTKPKDGDETPKDGADTVESLQAKIEATTDSLEKGKLVQQIRALRAVK